MTPPNVRYPNTQCAVPECFVLALRKALPLSSVTGKKQAVKYLWTSISLRRDGATLSSAYMTPILSIINNAKKSSTRWSMGLGSLKYKQIKPQNKRTPFFSAAERGARRKAAGPAARGRRGKKDKESPCPAAPPPQPRRTTRTPHPRARALGRGSPGAAAGTDPHPRAPAHLPCRSSPASSPRPRSGPPHGRARRGAGPAARAARLGHRRGPGPALC